MSGNIKEYAINKLFIVSGETGPSTRALFSGHLISDSGRCSITGYTPQDVITPNR
jgi:hypothetical protein